MGVGVVACDAALRVVASSAAARPVLARLATGAAIDALPEPLAALNRDGERSGRVDAAGKTYVVSVRAVDGAAAWVLWLRPEPGARDLDATLRSKWGLTRRQLDLVHQLRHGHRNLEIANNLGLTHSTVKSYMSHLFDQLGVRSRAEAIALIERVGRED